MPANEYMRRRETMKIEINIKTIIMAAKKTQPTRNKKGNSWSGLDMRQGCK